MKLQIHCPRCHIILKEQLLKGLNVVVIRLIVHLLADKVLLIIE